MAEQSGEQDSGEKTEAPSERKLEKAIEQGQVVTSREVNSFLMLFAFTIIFMWILPNLTVGSPTLFIRSIVENAGNLPMDADSIGSILKKIVYKALLFLTPLLVIVVVVSIFSSFIQRGHFVLAIEQIQPKLSRMSIIAGFKRMFSMQSVVELLKGLIKVLVVGFFIYLFVMIDIKDLKMYPHMSVGAINHKIYEIIVNVLICVSITSAAIAALDYGYQKYKHIESLKMTKQEVKEEYKETEGHPEIKKKQRSIQMSMSRKRMMAAIPQADVVITNPEHYAVALKYDADKMQAPVVVAKGLDAIAQAIKEIAKAHAVPIIENPPLARMLYKDTKLDKQIPAQHYAAVAQIISYVYRLKNKNI